MLYFRMKYKCGVCDNQQKWYIQPVEEKTATGDHYNSNTRFEITCKKCGQRYILTLDMRKKRK